MPGPIKITFLGTNGWFSTETGETVSVLIDTQDYAIICDAGNGIRRLDQYADFNKPAYLFLSHFHIDHISGLHNLNKFRFKQGLTICCFKGGKKILNAFMKQPFTISLNKLNFPVKVKELSAGVHERFPFTVECRKLVHSATCFGYRFTIQGRTISYCTDTGRCPAMLRLARKVDLLITECAFKSGQTSKTWPHLNPEDAAHVAQEAQARKLVLMHFDAYVYQKMKEREQARQYAKRIFKHTIAAHDKMQIVVK